MQIHIQLHTCLTLSQTPPHVSASLTLQFTLLARSNLASSSGGHIDVDHKLQRLLIIHSYLLSSSVVLSFLSNPTAVMFFYHLSLIKLSLMGLPTCGRVKPCLAVLVVLLISLFTFLLAFIGSINNSISPQGEFMLFNVI